MGYRITKEGAINNPKGETLKGYICRGYTFLSIRDGDNHMKVSAHRLQAYQKFGEAMFEDKILVRHLNDIGTDNRWDNIAIGTQSDNMMDMPSEKRLQKARHASSHLRKYDHEKIRAMYNECGSYKEVMIAFDMKNKSTLHYIINGK